VGKISIHLAREWDAEDMAPRMREADVEEVKAACGMSPLQALRYSLAACDKSFTVEIDHCPMAIFGLSVGSLLSETAYPWMLGARGFPGHHGKTLLRHSRAIIAIWLEDFEKLENYVMASNHASVKYLAALGAAFAAPAPYGVASELFLRFELRR